MRVGWYVHHHGAGHRTRASVLGEELGRRGHDVWLLGSSVGQASGFAGGIVPLPMDHPLEDDVPEHRADVSAGGLLHWAPLRHNGLRRRMAGIAGWVEEHRPDVFVVDVSSEVALLVRLLGIPVVLVAQPGDRRDRGHQSALATASAVLGPWPGWATGGLWRAGASGDAGDTGDTGQEERVVAVGGVARLPGPRRIAAPDGTRRPRGLVLAGSEGFEHPGLADLVATSVTDVDWTVADGRTWLPDVPALLLEADVVVTHAGQNSIAEVASAGVPAVVVPQRRPFDEQDHMAQVLGESGLARVVDRTSVAGTDWRDVVAEAIERGGQPWSRWETEGAVGRAATLVEEVARG